MIPLKQQFHFTVGGALESHQKGVFRLRFMGDAKDQLKLRKGKYFYRLVFASEKDDMSGHIRKVYGAGRAPILLLVSSDLKELDQFAPIREASS